MHPAGDAELFASGDFAFHVKLRRRIVTHQNSGEPRADPSGSHGRDFAFKLGEDLVADFQAIENARGHVQGTPMRKKKNNSTEESTGWPDENVGGLVRVGRLR